MKKKKVSKKPQQTDDEMLPEYDFSGGVRVNHYKAYRKGHTVTVHKADGSKQVQHFTRKDGAVMLETDVRRYFHDSDSVNKALRGLITLLPTKPRTRQTS